MDVKKFALKTLADYGTNDPFEICRQLGIEMLYLPLGRMRGYCYKNEDGQAIVLNDNLDEHEAGVVCAHELGHELRHTFCTLLYLAGVDVLTARDQMGHASVQVTQEIYTHLDAKHKAQKMEALDGYLTNAANNMQVKCKSKSE